jgi:DNA invertase Pin-like site-specific DNA recombinase
MIVKGPARKEPTKALAYLRTSSATNIGADKDSEVRQREVIQRFAAREGFVIVAEFRDPAVSGKDPIDTRPGFKDLLTVIAANGTRVVIVESPDRFARHLMTQEAGIALLVELGVRVLTSHGDDLTDSDDEFRVAMRQVMGIFAQLERTRLVKKLKAARERKRANGERVEGRKSRIERLLAKNDTAGAKRYAEAVALAKRLHRASPKTGERHSLRAISVKLAKAGHLNEKGRPFNPKTVAAMVRGRRPEVPEG